MDTAKQTAKYDHVAYASVRRGYQASQILRSGSVRQPLQNVGGPNCALSRYHIFSLAQPLTFRSKPPRIARRGF
jgi:hypothetical protein